MLLVDVHVDNVGVLINVGVVILVNFGVNVLIDVDIGVGILVDICIYEGKILLISQQIYNMLQQNKNLLEYINHLLGITISSVGFLL